MTISIPITQDNRNRLVQEKERLQEQNLLLQDSNESSIVNVADNLILDVPFKKQTDSKHTDIYFFEEELRRLDGRSVLFPVQETGFVISDSNTNSRLKLNNGRLIIEENSIEVLDIPLIPTRGYSKSTPAGTNFDVWSRDRFGSSTSEINPSSTFTITTSNCRLKLAIDGVDQEVDLSTLLVLPQSFPGAALASTIQVLLNNIGTGGFTRSICGFNESLRVFTIASGTSGPLSTVLVKPASSNDIRSTIGYLVQKQIVGKYQNNILNVEIDGVANEIRISDFRKCETDPDLGSNNDDIGFFWSGLDTQLGYLGNTRVGPLFCSGINNGKEVAQSIQAKLREVGTGGFENATCLYFTDEKVFQIFSGTFGSSSSVKILPASDSNRDLRTLIGYNPPQEEIGNEEYFDTIGSLTTELDSIPSLDISEIGDLSVLSHSILYLSENGIKIDSSFQDFIVATTKIYDDASRGLGRLYPNGRLVVDSTNNKINLFETLNIERTVTLNSGSYSEGEIARELQNQLGVNYTVDYDPQSKKFIISSTGSFTLLWGTGKDCVKAIGTFLGFSSVDTSHSSSHISDYSIIFGNEDFFNPKFPKQFYSPSEGLPLVVDTTIDEQYALNREEDLLDIEDSDILIDIENLTAYENEILLDYWEDLASDELDFVNQEYNALRVQRGFYSGHVSESDTEFNLKTTALNNLIPNRDSLIDLLSAHGRLIGLEQDVKTFIANVDFTHGGIESLPITIIGVDNPKIYNRPAPLVRYASGGNHIQGTFVPPGLFNSSVVFNPELNPVFNLTNTRSGTQGYCYSGEKVSGFYDILYGSEQPVNILSSNSQNYNLNSGDDLKMKVDDGVEQTAVFNGTAGYTESVSTVDSKFLIRNAVNDRIDFEETNGVELTATLTPGLYSGSDLATEIKTKLDLIGASTYTVSYSGSKFTISSDGLGGGGIFKLRWSTGTYYWRSVGSSIGFNVSSDDSGLLSYISDYFVNFNILAGRNDQFFIEIDGIVCSSVIVISSGIYIISSLITEMINQIANDPNFSASDFAITYVSSKFRITSSIMGTNSKIRANEGTNDFLRMIELVGDVPVDGTGNVGNLDSVTAAEVASVLNSGITGVSCSDISGKVNIATVSSEGSLSTVEITGGAARTIIGFSLTIFYGKDKKNKLKVNIDSFPGYDAIELAVSPNPISGNDIAADIQTKLRAIGFGGWVNATCGFNEDLPYLPLPDLQNKLRIVSGTQGTSSKVEISDKTIEIVTGVNDTIDFTEFNFVSYMTATIAPGFYNGTTLAIEIQTKLNAVGLSNYTVTFAGDKITFISDGTGYDGVFKLYFASGPNSFKSIAKTIGFKLQDYTGALIYVSFGFVKTDNIWDELIFDSNTVYTGQTVSTVTATLDDTNFTSVLGLAGVPPTRLELDINITTPPNDKIAGLIATINSQPYYSCLQVSAYLIGRVCEPFDIAIADNDTFIVKANGGVDQTITFNAVKGKSQSGTNPVTRISLNDRFKISLNGSQYYEIILETQPNAEKIAAKIQEQVRTIVPTFTIVTGANDRIDFVLAIVPLTTTLSPGTYSANLLASEIQSKMQLVIGVSPVITVSFTNNRFVISSDGVGPSILSLLWNTGANSARSVGSTIGFDTSSDDIGFLTYQSDYTVEISRAAFCRFQCSYIGGKYILESGTGGTLSSVKVANALVNNAAGILKLGVMNGGTETSGSGDFLNNSSVSLSEIVSIISSLPPVGFSVAGSVDYLKVASAVAGVTSRIQISGTTLVKLGFDYNDDSLLSLDLSNADSTLIADFTGSIKSPIVKTATIGWDTSKGNVNIDFSKIRNTYVISRQSVVSTRLTNIAARKPEITARASAIMSLLTPTLYEERRDAINLRLNKKTGSYVKVGNELNSQDSNNNSIGANTNTINEIDDIL